MSMLVNCEVREKESKTGKKYKVLAIEIYKDVWKEEYLTQEQMTLLNLKYGNK